MSTEEHRAKELFERTLELPSDQRGAMLDAECGADVGLRARVDSLLSALGQADGFLADAGAAVVEQSGQVIGRYKLLQQIGEGGFGSVWMAEQMVPVRRRLALKIIKLGMDTRQVVARFEAERQALAMMDHPGIAKVLDAGSTETGRPYFVMELVRGVPITQYCDEAGLSVEERLALVEQVCEAVQHAHQKGVIHRDLKPSNVLVSVRDGVAAPKVIDFGIAKATNQELTQKTLFTELRQMVGTPEYMAPEQAELSGLDVDTRADVYSLGVMLYELLTGTLPFEMEDARRRGYDEMVRRIRESDPPKPSTRISGLDQRLAAIAKQRKTEPRRLGRMLRGELDWVVMRALEKERGRRYPTASALAEDLRRYLADLPVEASPPSALYRLRKFGRRNRTAVAAAAAVVVALVAGGAAALVGMQRAQEAEGRAQHQAARATAVLSLMEDLLGTANPHEHKGPDYTVRALLQEFDQELTRSPPEVPAVEAALRFTMGRAFRRLGLFDAAEANLARALELRGVPIPGVATGEAAAPAEVADVLWEWTWLLHDRGDYREAMDALSDARAAAERRGDPVAEMARFVYTEADLLRHFGELPEAEAAARRAVAMLADAGARGEHVAHAHDMLGLALSSAGRNAEAAEAYWVAIEVLREMHDGDHLSIAALQHNYGLARFKAGERREGERDLRQALAVRERLLGEEHHLAHTSRRALSTVLYNANQLAEAEDLARRALAYERARLPQPRAETTEMVFNLAQIRRYRGDLDEAAELHRQALADYTALGAAPAVLQRSNGLLAEVCMGLGQHAEAERLARAVWRWAEQEYDEGHPSRLAAQRRMGVVLRGAGRLEAAVPWLQAVVDAQRAAGAEPSARLASDLALWGATLADLERWAAAAPVLAECAEMRRALMGDHWLRWNAESLWGLALFHLDRHDEAEPRLRAAAENLRPPARALFRRREAVERVLLLCRARAADGVDGAQADAEHWEGVLATLAEDGGPPK